MKKLYTMICATAVALTAAATDYTHPMAVQVGESLVPVEAATISLNEEGETNLYSLVLHNFVFGTGAEAMPIGNVEATGLQATAMAGIVTIDASTTATITAGDDPNVNMWVGPVLFPQLPVNVNIVAMPKAMEATIALTVPGVGDVKVYFGDNTVAGVMGNSGPTTFDYSEPLAVEMAGAVAPQGEASLSVEFTAENKANFLLKNFVYTYPDGSGNLAFGNVEVPDVDVAIDMTTGTFQLTATTTANITAGDDPSVTMWMGPVMFPTLPVALTMTATPMSLEGKVNLTVPMVGALVVYVGKDTVAEAGMGKVTASEAEIAGIYDLTGIKVSEMIPGHVYIVKMTDGTCHKMVK